MNSKIKEMTICSLFTALIAIGAFLKITIPIEPVDMHFTLQWLFVLMAGFLLGSRLGTISVGLYLFIGLIGVPIFASGGGPAYLMRPTFGFLLGFLFAVWIIGFLSKKIKEPTFTKYLIPSIAGLLIYYGCGMIYFYFMNNFVLGVPVSVSLVIVNCFLLTVFPDFLLCILSVIASIRIKPYVNIS